MTKLLFFAKSGAIEFQLCEIEPLYWFQYISASAWHPGPMGVTCNRSAWELIPNALRIYYYEHGTRAVRMDYTTTTLVSNIWMVHRDNFLPAEHRILISRGIIGVVMIDNAKWNRRDDVRRI